MKQLRIIGIALLLCLSYSAMAVPAKPGKKVKIQPDGTRITLELHGDEFYHWRTDENGNVVALDADGFYRPAEMPDYENLGGREFAAAQAAAIRAKRAQMKAQSRQIGFGVRAASYTTYHFPVFLVQFSDVTFTVDNPQNTFYRLMNEEGYSDNGATGSVHDFYWENSMETFYAEFDVFGPYSYNGTCADNADENDAAKILWAAMKNYDSQVDFSKYDNDGDGTVDMVFLYYAGYNEAENNENTIWPHKYNFSYAGVSTTRLDGVSFDIYACTSELQGLEGSNEICGIGTAAHEFSHTQGLPDLYDTNYDNYGDGTAGATYSYDIMCSGSYNNSGRTPPYFNALERYMMGWMDAPSEVPARGDITLASIDKNAAYKITNSSVTSGDGEYFILECRKGTGWDAYVDPGLLVYHVDKSKEGNVTFYRSSSSSVSQTPYAIWNSYSQYINASGDHPCFYLVPAADQTNLNIGNESKIPFPGNYGISTYAYSGWYGHEQSDLFYNIRFNAGAETVTMTRGEGYKGVSGVVTDNDGIRLPGVTVNIYTAYSGARLSSIGKRITGGTNGNLVATTTTDENGLYAFDLNDSDESEFCLEFIGAGYLIKTASVNYNNLTKDVVLYQNASLRGVNEPIDYTLRKFGVLDSSTSLYLIGTGQSIMAAASFSPQELTSYVGRKILSLSFFYYSDSVTGAYGVIDFGDDRKATVKVSSPTSASWNTVDVSSLNLTVPSDQTVYIGYALDSPSYTYPLVYEADDPVDGGFYYSAYNTKSSSWTELASYGNVLVYATLDDSSYFTYNYIDNPGYGSYELGSSLDLTLVEAAGSRKPGTDISWFYDDEPVDGTSVTFDKVGEHLIEAHFETTEGKTKVVELKVSVL